MQHLIQFILRKRLLLVILGIAVLIAGGLSYNKLPIDAFPDVSPSLVQVFTVTEGLAPEEVEKYVTYPVEVVMNGLPGLEEIRSVSNFGLSVVNVYFEDGTDIYFARQLVNERLQEAREQIPEGFGNPQMGPISTGMGLILFYYLEDETGRYSLEELRTMQDWLVKYQLQTVPGVTEVLGIGGYEKQYQVVADPHGLQRFDITINELHEKIQSNNLNVGAQFIEKNSEEFIVRSIGLASNIRDIKNIILKSVDGTPIYLNQVADVRIGGAIRRGLQTMNGVKEVVAGMVVKLYGANSSTVINRVETQLKEINSTLPEGVQVVPYYEQKTLVQDAVSTVTDALLQGIILVVIVLMIFLGAFRPGLVVALSIPFSVLFAIIGMNVFNISANLMSFGGLAIAIGMMVDGTIVIVENVTRMLQEADPDESKFNVIARATLEVARPILFAISIIILVFVPLMTLQGVEGKTFRPMAYTIGLAMVGSLIFSLLLAPVLSSLLMKKPDRDAEDEKEAREFFVVRWLKILYQPVVTFFVRHRGMAVVLAVALIAAGSLIFPRLGSEYSPTLQEGTVVCRLTMSPSIALTETKRVTMIVEQRILEIEEVEQVISRIGRGEIGAHTDPVNSAEIYVLLRPEDEWRSAITQHDLVEILRHEVEEVPGVMANFTQPIQMTVDELLEGVKAELAVKLFGDDLDVLITRAEEIAGVIRQVPGAADVQVDQVTGTPQLQIKINRHAIARYGINVADVQKVIRTAVGGETAGEIFEGIRRFDIFVRFVAEYRDDRRAIGNLLIETPTGASVPLDELADISEIVGPRQIKRENNQRFITVQCNVNDRDIGTFVAEAQQEIDNTIALPAGYYTTWGGQFRLQQEANKRFAVVIPVTLLILFFMLFSSFNSLKNALLILLNIPLALVGGIIALWLTGQNLSVPSSVGFIALFGIALENSMVMVTYQNQLLRDGLPVDRASIQGAMLRLRPVLMTALTTALGLIPLLLATGTGSEVQRPLATVVIGGLVTSTILTLLIIPALYKWFTDRVEYSQF